MILAGRNQVMPNRSLEYNIRKFKEFGYDGIELSLIHGMSSFVMTDYLDHYIISHTVELCRELDNFKITALAAHANYVTDDFIFDVQKSLLKAAPRYGTNIVIMSTFTPFELRENNPSLYKELEIRTRELAKMAEEYGVYIAIEVEPGQLFRNLDIFLAMADRINSPALKLNFDVGHIYLSEVDIIKAIERSKQYIVHSHIDNMCMGEHCHKLPWDGEIDLVSAYRKLKSAGFDGGVSVDIYLQDYEAVSPQCVKYIKEEVFSKL
ncbi:sugar phosphate isomerase/epimerase family protein [Ruminiclostridium cellobioparum]|uniref:Sugar phosphate isomerase/epimerase n=1 Tax=Ruminiclostridium cellobioparum subsp. termitidis CT1112 TaxID=1195236 RepID=S0FLL1_RUMCE|nr:sugar phosphate isomerase/epimerase [Ruminiclostridium cellobioparum]EMS71206.1 sugar phosphate isomerase/epimerase [Ruminiclostridium cellobioparum subsp. termitidis CT1112]